LVESRKGILSKVKLALRPIQILASRSRRQGSSSNAPLHGVSLTPLSARNARGVRGAAKTIMKKYEKTLDNAADVIHGNWLPQVESDLDCFVAAPRRSSCLLHQGNTTRLVHPT